MAEAKARAPASALRSERRGLLQRVKRHPGPTAAASGGRGGGGQGRRAVRRAVALQGGGSAHAGCAAEPKMELETPLEKLAPSLYESNTEAACCAWCGLGCGCGCGCGCRCGGAGVRG